jgi:hypothetical protein
MALIRRVFTLMALLVSAVLASRAFGEGLSFDFAFVSRGPAGELVPLDFRVDQEIGPERQFKFLISPKQGFIYLILVDAQEEVSLLYPAYTSRGFVRPAANEVPPGEAWFCVDASQGVEKFELIACASRPSRLEDALLRWCKASAEGRSATSGDLRESLLNEMAALKRASGRFAEVAGKPTSFGGSVRGSDLSAFPVSTIEAEGSYARTIRVKH